MKAVEEAMSENQTEKAFDQLNLQRIRCFNPSGTGIWHKLARTVSWNARCPSNQSQFAVVFNNSQGFDEFRVGDMFCARPKQFQDFPGLLASHEVSLLPCLMVNLA